MFEIVALNFRLFSCNNERHMRMYRTLCLGLITMLLYGCEESVGTSVTSHQVWYKNVHLVFVPLSVARNCDFSFSCYFGSKMADTDQLSDWRLTWIRKQTSYRTDSISWSMEYRYRRAFTKVYNKFRTI